MIDWMLDEKRRKTLRIIIGVVALQIQSPFVKMFLIEMIAFFLHSYFNGKIKKKIKIEFYMLILSSFEEVKLEQNLLDFMKGFLLTCPPPSDDYKEYLDNILLDHQLSYDYSQENKGFADIANHFFTIMHDKVAENKILDSKVKKYVCGDIKRMMGENEQIIMLCDWDRRLMRSIQYQ